MADFFEAKFKYLVTFEEFRWMPYLTVQYSVYENLIREFFSNATLEDASKKDEDSCRIGEIHTYVIGITIRVTQENVATAFSIPNEGLSDEHASYPTTMSSPMIILRASHCMRDFYTCLCHTSSDP